MTSPAAGSEPNDSGAVVTVLVTAVAAAVLAVVGGVSLTSALSATPDPVEKPLVVYDAG